MFRTGGVDLNIFLQVVRGAEPAPNLLCCLAPIRELVLAEMLVKFFDRHLLELRDSFDVLGPLPYRRGVYPISIYL
jgi:hypothetical protein